jgi:hypothetical protein
MFDWLTKPKPQPTVVVNPDLSVTITNTGTTVSPDLPNYPANFTTFQIPGSSSNSLNINISTLQKCMMENPNSESLNNCITSNIYGYDKQATSYQNVNYIGPGHSIDALGNVNFGPFDSKPQTFDNIERSTFNNSQLIFYVVIVIIYLFIMLKK